jgi:hypothetical protein
MPGKSIQKSGPKQKPKGSKPIGTLSRTRTKTSPAMGLYSELQK